MKQRGEVLDLAAAGAELEHAAAVEGDVVGAAEVVELEQRLQAAEAGWLGIEGSRLVRQRLDIGDGVDRSVPRDPVQVRLQDLLGPVAQGGVLEPRAGEAFGHAPVQIEIQRRLGSGLTVEGLEVDDVDPAASLELADEVIIPAVAGVELEAELRVELEP